MGIMQEQVNVCFKGTSASTLRPLLPWIVASAFDRDATVVGVMKNIAKYIFAFFILSVVDIGASLTFCGLYSVAEWLGAVKGTIAGISAYVLVRAPSFILAYLWVFEYGFGSLGAVYALSRFWAFVSHDQRRAQENITSGVGMLEMKINSLDNQAQFTLKRHLSSCATNASRALE